MYNRSVRALKYDQVDDIQRLHRLGMKNKDIAELTGFSESTVNQVTRFNSPEEYEAYKETKREKWRRRHGRGKPAEENGFVTVTEKDLVIVYLEKELRRAEERAEELRKLLRAMKAPGSPEAKAV